MRTLAATLALVLAAPLGAEGLPAWRAVDAATGQIADVAGLEQLARDFPDSSSVRLRLLNAQLEAGDTRAALESLAWLKLRGHVFGEATRASMLRLLKRAKSQEVEALLPQRADIIEASAVAYTFRPGFGLIESVIGPAAQGTYVATSLTGKAAVVGQSSTSQTDYRLPEADDLSGLVYDRMTAMFWFASSNLDGSIDREPGFAGLIGIPTGSNNWQHAPLPAGAAIADLSIGADGTIYGSDPLHGGIYRKAREADRLELFVASGTFRSPQGSAVSADGKTLYISDYRYGLAVVDTGSGRVSRLASNIPLMLDGIDGLWLFKGELIAVQNGTSPMRISAFTLSQDGSRITSARVLEQAHPEWTEPLGGSIDADALVYVATGQWDRYEQGRLREGMTAIPTVIRRLPLLPR